MTLRKVFYLFICILIVQPLYGQESNKKLEFQKGIPDDLKSTIKNVSEGNCSYAAIELEVPKDILYIIQYDLPDGRQKFYRVRKSLTGDFIRFDFHPAKENGSLTKRIILDEDENYNYLIVLNKKGNDIFYSIENEKTVLEHGFFYGMGAVFDSESISFLKSADKKFHNISSDLFELCYSLKLNLNPKMKFEVKAGLMGISQLKGYELGTFIHYRINPNLYLVAGVNLFIKYSKKPFYFKEDTMVLTYTLPTVSVVYYFNKRFYMTNSIYLNTDNKLNSYNRKLNSGYSIGFGANF